MPKAQKKSQSTAATAAPATTVVKTIKTRLYLDDPASIAYFERAFGVRRACWNWFVNYTKTHSDEVSRSKAVSLFYKEKAAQYHDSLFDWLAKQYVAAKIPEAVFAQGATNYKMIKDIEEERVFKWKQQVAKQQQKPNPNTSKAKLARRKKRKLPKKQPRIELHFKKKKDRKQTCSMLNETKSPTIKIDKADQFLVHFRGSQIQVPDPNNPGKTKQSKIAVFGKVRESLAFLRSSDVKIGSFTVKREAGRYWLSITYEIPNQKLALVPTSGKIGIDLGVKIPFYSFDGMNFDHGTFHTKGSIKSDRLAESVNLSRKQEGSKNYEKAVLLKEKRYLRGVRQRKAELEEKTTFWCQNYHEIVLDDYSFESALYVSKAGEAYRSMKYLTKLRLEEKAREYGNLIRLVNHAGGVKTSKKCSCCGSLNCYIRRDRTFVCRNCHFTADRDQNAAVNTYNA